MKISIIIPALNEEKYLPLLLDSIKKQDFEDYEVIVADAGSKDKTVEIAKKYGCAVVRGGAVSAGRNRGAEAARGDIFLFLDADAILPSPQFLGDALKEVSQRDLGSAGFALRPIAGKKIDLIAFWVWNTTARIAQTFLPHAAAAILAKKDVHRAIGGFNEQALLAEDHSYAREAAKIAKFGFIKKSPVFVSIRRYEKDGRLKIYTKYVLAGFYIMFWGPIKTDIFKYKFDHYSDDKNSRPKNNFLRINFMNNMYNLSELDFSEIKKGLAKILKNRLFKITVAILFLSCVIGGAGAVAVYKYFPAQTELFLHYLRLPQADSPRSSVEVGDNPKAADYVSSVPYEQAIIDAVKKSRPSVVSIVISKMVPIYEQQWVNPFGGNNQDPFWGELNPFNFQIPQYVQKGSKLQEVGAGSGFIVSADGLVLTNKHVVSDNKAEYTVFTNDGKKYTAKVLALDPVQDLAVIKIDSSGDAFQPVVFGNSDGIQVGQTAIAIGNALGQFRNTVSVGVVSGLGRTISASDRGNGFSETLEGIIQTDAAINPGNSGGPLLNLRGEVIGVNVAMAEGADAIGFALPINIAKKDIEQVQKSNKIVYPFLGVRYINIDEKVKQEYKLSVYSGALVLRGDKGEPAVTAGSAAAKAGIKEKDVILEINGEKITEDKSMASIIQKYNPGDKIVLKILRDGKEMDIEATLDERAS